MSGEFTTSGRWGAMPVVREVAEARERTRIVVTGAVIATTSTTVGGSPAYRCEISDGTGVIGVAFLGRAVVPGFVEGARCTIEGTVLRDGPGLVVWNPRYRFEPSSAS